MQLLTGRFVFVRISYTALGNLLEFLDEIYPVKIRGMGLTNGEKFHDPNFNRFFIDSPV